MKPSLLLENLELVVGHIIANPTKISMKLVDKTPLMKSMQSKSIYKYQNTKSRNMFHEIRRYTSP